jgi:predicted MFS family arabinose efflux permease
VAVSGIGFGQLLVIGVFATLLAAENWQWVFLGLGAAHLLLLPLLLVKLPYGRLQSALIRSDQPVVDSTLRQSLPTGKLWHLVFIYAICGFQDFFVATHIVALAQDSGVSAILSGNLLALMGLASAIGVLFAGILSDRNGPKSVLLLCFFLRLCVFAMILLNQSAASMIIFGLVFGFTFLQTAPLAVIFVRDNFGMTNLGAISGLIVMLHQMWGGIGAYLGALAFELRGSYDILLFTMLILSIAAIAASAVLPSAGSRAV